MWQVLVQLPNAPTPIYSLHFDFEVFVHTALCSLRMVLLRACAAVACPGRSHRG